MTFTTFEFVGLHPTRSQPSGLPPKIIGCSATIATVKTTPAPSAARQPDALTQTFTRVKRWFTEGNVPVKVGVIVLFLGVGALLKYAADSGWLRVPVEFRLAGIAAAALGALVFAWRKRESHRAFAWACSLAGPAPRGTIWIATTTAKS